MTVHASLPHILFNMNSFASVGQRLEHLVGSLGLLQLAVVLAITKAFVLGDFVALFASFLALSRVRCQYLYLCTSKASKLSLGALTRACELQMYFLSELHEKGDVLTWKIRGA